jgi:hypothetical protein
MQDSHLWHCHDMNCSRSFDTIYFVRNVISSAAYRNPYNNVTSTLKFNYFPTNKGVTDLGILCRQVCNAQGTPLGKYFIAIHVISSVRTAGRIGHY